MFFRCNMERVSNSGRAIQPAAFHSNIKANLDGTDEEELSHKMFECYKRWLRFNQGAVGGDCIVLFS